MTIRKLSFAGIWTARPRPWAALLLVLSLGLLLPPAVQRAEAQLAQAAAKAQAQTEARAQAYASAVKSPFLWRIEGPVPSYLYGTIHVPDPRVTSLPPSVEQAFASSGGVFTEIPMDGALQIGMMSKMLLPGDQNLSQVLGPELHARLNDTIERSLPQSSMPMRGAMSAMLSRMKPWAAMVQLAMIEFLPDMMAGTKALDTALYERAKKEGKEIGGLETIDEQLAVFEGLTMDEQVRMLKLTLDAMDESLKAGRSASRELIDGYITGDLDKLAAMSNDSMKGEPELQRNSWPACSTPATG
jgi:uncharacterized protein